MANDLIRWETPKGWPQKWWDWGNWRTWTIVLIICATGLFIAICAYVLPQGRHDSPPAIRLY